ncbi:MAG: two-component regulator propeller domain-containing protein [Bacteroidales bacterium]|nr:two-component regulator propeller domain-containing protein [Bacteroidales bacterium]
MTRRFSGLFLNVVAAMLAMQCVLNAAPADNKYYFTSYTTANSGIPYDMVNAIVQDDYGFIWVGTSSGISRFDGTRFKTWKKWDIGLSSDYVVSMAVDKGGNIWFGTDRGVTVYWKEEDRFVPFAEVSDIGTRIVNKTNSIKVAEDGSIWLSVNGQGLFRFDPSTRTLKNYFFVDGKQAFPVNICTFQLTPDNRVLIDLYCDGIYEADDSLTSLKPLLPRSLAAEFRNDDIVEFLMSPGSDNILYVASVRKGLCEVNIALEELKILIPSSLGFNPEKMFIDSNKQIWLSTSSGVYIFNLLTDTFKVLTENPDDPFALNDSHVFSVLIDSDNGLWVGTNVGGLNYAGVAQSHFEKVYMAEGKSLGGCLVRGIADGSDGLIWVTTEKSGLLNYNPATGELKHCNVPGIPKSLFPVCEYAGYIWIGTMKGLIRLNPGTGRIKAYSLFEQSDRVVDSKVHSLYKTERGDFLVGTTLGLHRYDRNNDRFIPMAGLGGKFITDISEDKTGSLWLATYADGIINYNIDSSIVVNNVRSAPSDSSSIPSNKIFSIITDSRGLVWAASFTGGFFCYNPKDGSVRKYSSSTSSDIDTDVFFKIVEDDDGQIWASSDKGLFSLNLSNNSVVRYTTSDGLLNNQFKNCGLKTEDGTLYLGSKNGFIRFSPRDLRSLSGPAEVLVSEFRIGDSPVVPGPGSPVEGNINETAHIHLSPKQNSFGFSFSTPGSVPSGGMKRIMCLLEGYDKDWRTVDNDNSVSYFNVPAGNYTLRLRCFANDGVWADSRVSIPINVARRFYESPYALLIYLLILSLIIGGISRAIYNKAMRQEKQKQAEYEKRKEQEQYEEKMTFFSNVIHEIKTPLTLIKAPLQNIIASGSVSGGIKEDLEVIQHSSDYLDRLVKELLEFVRIERHGYRMNPRRVDIVDKISFLCSDYAETARARNLSLEFEHSDDHIYIEADESALDKMLNNLLHNAVKYAETEVFIKLYAEGDNARVEFGNDGPEIPGSYREEIFKPFIRYSTEKEPYSQSFGIGLPLARTLAELHNGSLRLSDSQDCTIFELVLPLHPAVSAPISEPETVPGLPEDALTLLVVEDNAELSSYLTRKLGEHYNVLPAGTAEEGLRILKRQDVDIILTDIALPSMSGVEFCSRVTTDIELSHIPVVVVSAITSESTKISCIENGASLYIEKPFTLEYLFACIKGIMAKRESLKKTYRTATSEIDVRQYNLVDTDKDFLRRLDEAVIANISDPSFSSKQMEEALFLSRSTLIRKVKALLGTTPNDYLKKKRLAEAARLLSESNVRINEVCYAVGFNSPSWFAKCFKDEYGVLPADYRDGKR